MFKWITAIALVCLMVSGFGFAATSSSSSRTWGSSAPVAVSTEVQETTTTKEEVKSTVVIRGTAGAWGIGQVTTMKTEIMPVVPTGSVVSLKEVIKAEIVEEETEEPMPTSGVGITEAYPNDWLAHTWAAQRNAMYLLISLFGVFWLMLVMRKEDA